MRFKVSDLRNRRRTRIGFRAAKQGRRELERSWNRDKFGQYPPRELLARTAPTGSRTRFAQRGAGSDHLPGVRRRSPPNTGLIGYLIQGRVGPTERAREAR